MNGKNTATSGLRDEPEWILKVGKEDNILFNWADQAVRGRDCEKLCSAYGVVCQRRLGELRLGDRTHIPGGHVGSRGTRQQLTLAAGDDEEGSLGTVLQTCEQALETLQIVPWRAQVGRGRA